MGMSSTEPDQDVTPALGAALAEPESAPIDTDALPPTQYLVMEVLSARARLGETCWPFPDRLRPALTALADLGLLRWQPGNVPHTCRTFLTDAGRRAALDDAYQPPADRKIEAERERIAQHMESLAANYPEDVFCPEGTSRDAIGGSAMRHAYLNAARAIRAGDHES
jgi:hypothetical protein